MFPTIEREAVNAVSKSKPARQEANVVAKMSKRYKKIKLATEISMPLPLGDEFKRSE